MPTNRVVQHNHWYPKDCPRLLRNPGGKWEEWLKRVETYRANSSDAALEAAYDSVTDPLWAFGLKLFKCRYPDGRDVLVCERAILEDNPGKHEPWNVTIRHCGKEVAHRLLSNGELEQI